MLTLISHFWNNACILPYWLRHHGRLFEHGILIDHGATDGSAELVHALAPGWEVRPTTRCREAYLAAEADIEVMAVESEVKGWKMVLNVTEFVVHYNLEAYVRGLPPGVQGVTTSGVVLVDTPQSRGIPLTDEAPFLQRTWGYFEYELGKRPEDYGFPAVWRSRLLHCYPNGRYEVGRHVTHVPHMHDPFLFLAWTGWAPFDLIAAMKFETQNRIPTSEFEAGRSVQHRLPSMAELERRLVGEQARSHDLLVDRYYAAMLDRLRRYGYAPLGSVG